MNTPHKSTALAVKPDPSTTLKAKAEDAKARAKAKVAGKKPAEGARETDAKALAKGRALRQK